MVIGIGGPCKAPDEIARSYDQAHRTTQTLWRLGRTGAVSAFEDLGIHRLLLQVPDLGELRSFAAEVLGKLSEHEHEHKSEYLSTLACYFRENNSPQRASRLLHVHPNTVAYRIKRIEEITGLRLDNYRDRLIAQVALEILDALPEAQYSGTVQRTVVARAGRPGMSGPSSASTSAAQLLSGERVLVCDGAMGTMLHAAGAALDRSLPELNLSDPGLVATIHDSYLTAGVDIIQANTFGANRLWLADHGFPDKVAEINRAGVRLARMAADRSAPTARASRPGGRVGVAGGDRAAAPPGRGRRADGGARASRSSRWSPTTPPTC